jgi:hypothetical protein
MLRAEVSDEVRAFAPGETEARLDDMLADLGSGPGADPASLLRGGAGDDTLIGGSANGIDTLVGGAGDDTFGIEWRTGNPPVEIADYRAEAEDEESEEIRIIIDYDTLPVVTTIARADDVVVQVDGADVALVRGVTPDQISDGAIILVNPTLGTEMPVALRGALAPAA